MLILLIIGLRFMGHPLPCPKCGGFSWLKIEGEQVMQHCVCGLNRFIRISKDGDVMTRIPVRETQLVLPARGTQLSRILGCLVALGDQDSQAIAVSLQITCDKATTNLSVLRSRGLVQVVSERKGQLGGSLWTTFPAVRKRFNNGR